MPSARRASRTRHLPDVVDGARTGGQNRSTTSAPGRPDIDESHRLGVRTRALLQAGHPGPSLAITVMIVLLAVPGRPGLGPTVLFAVAVLAGELSIGWSNDVLDAPADTAAGRTGKPIVAGLVSRRTVLLAAVTALGLNVVASFLVSVPTGVINLVMMAAGWAYNAGLKATLFSGLAYVVGFGLIPALAASVRTGHPAPQTWITGAAALLGLGGHFANVLPDLAADRISGVRGLPQRIAAAPGGATLVRVMTVGLLLGASVLIVLAPGGPLRWWQLGGLIVAGGLAVTGVVSRGRTPFLAAIAIAILDVVLFVTRSASLT